MAVKFMSDRATDYGSLKHNERRGDFVWDAKGMDGHRWNYRPEKKSGGHRRAHSGGGAAAPAAAPAPAAPAVDNGSWMLELIEAQRRAREAAYNAAAKAQQQNYSFATGQLDDRTDQALREAYINKMISLKDLPQQLASQGLSGGESETATAGLYNNYGSARAQLESERQRQLASLLNVYQQNMAKLEGQRATGEAADLARLMPQLAKLAAGNGPLKVSIAQGASPQDAADAAMRRLRRALGLEDEED